MVTPLRIEPAKTRIGMRELDHRTGDGIEVRLLWNPKTKAVSVSVAEREGSTFEFRVPPGDALEAFHHPYAYAAHIHHGSSLAA
jgi:hypothetical protein